MREFVMKASTYEQAEFCRLCSNMQELVRCKDCKNFRSENYVAPCKKVMRSEDADENWFCADGERKEGTTWQT